VRISVLGVALVAVGCGGAQHFDAAERATAISPRGDIAAEYEIDGVGGDQLAETKVWTRGAYEDRVDGREMTVIEVVFEVENDGPTPVVLSEIMLDSAEASGVSFEDLAPFRVEGDRVVEPGEEGVARAYFALEQRYDPEDIADFEVQWALRHGEGTYAQRTPFRQAPPDYYATYPYSPFYDPLFYPTTFGPYAGVFPPW